MTVMNTGLSFDLNRPQGQIAIGPSLLPNIPNWFLAGGYGMGKTTALVALAHNLIHQYHKHPVEIGVGSSTLGLLRKTLMGTMTKLLKLGGSGFTYNKNDGTLDVGNMRFTMVGLWDPDSIIAHNWSAFLGDEIDELEQTVGLASHVAVNERCRVPFPDGRPPFVVQASTVHGYRTMYQLTQELKERGEPYRLIRGATAENPANDPGYVARLASLYNENERLAFLEGRFVNLTTGRVYYAYDEDVNMETLQPVQDFETVYVGQDLNEGYSKGAAGVIRGNRFEIIAEFSFKNIGDAPRIMRNAWPRNRIVWIPDNSGKPVLGGYADEIQAMNIEMVYTGRNPPILDRVFIVNKMMQLGRMPIARGLKSIPMMLKTRQYDEHGRPEKGKGEKAPDHMADALDYLVFRVVADCEEFEDLYELTPSGRREE